MIYKYAFYIKYDRITMYIVKETKYFVTWLGKQTLKEQAQIQARIIRISSYGHFGLARKITDNIAELKWKNGRRVYFTLYIENDLEIVLLLIGGNKNTQKKDIFRAKSILKDIID